MTGTAEFLAELMRSTPFQPATNVWRAVELDAVQRHGLPHGRGLDLGCGDGKLTGIVCRALDPTGRQRQWVGVDIDPAETAQAETSSVYQRVHTASATAVPEPDGSFDFVFSNSVLEHLPQIDEVLAEVARLLRSGGRCVFTVPGPDFHACLAGGMRRGVPQPRYLRDIDTRCAHLRYWTSADWTERMHAAGLQLRVVKPYLSEHQTQRWERLSAWSGGLAWRLFGQRARPIEIQRRLRMRSPGIGVFGPIAAALSPLLRAGVTLDADVAATRYGCLLLDASKAAT